MKSSKWVPAALVPCIKSPHCLRGKGQGSKQQTRPGLCMAMGLTCRVQKLRTDAKQSADAVADGRQIPPVQRSALQRHSRESPVHQIPSSSQPAIMGQLAHPDRLGKKKTWPR